MKFFVLLYINSPVFEKQIKPAKNKRCFISLQRVFSLRLLLKTVFERVFELLGPYGIMYIGLHPEIKINMSVRIRPSCTGRRTYMFANI